MQISLSDFQDFPVSCSPKSGPFDLEEVNVNHLLCDIGNPLPANKTVSEVSISYCLCPVVRRCSLTNRSQ